jgi:lysophospholipid acyltransferase (LPLAT)-like uncharacterized protein
VLGVFTRALASTVTIDNRMNGQFYDPLAPDCPQMYIASVWHDTMLLPIMVRRTIRMRTPANRMTTLVSQHQDGSFLTYAMRYMDLGTVRGSTNRGGAAALRTLIDAVRTQHVCMTPDGPRGPRRIISPGIITLASLSGVPILPCTFMASHFWRIEGRWTDLILPRPFSTIYGLSAGPMEIPARLSKAGVEEFRLQLQAKMDHCQVLVDALARGEKVDETSPEITVRRAA